MLEFSAQSTIEPAAEGGFKRVLSLWDLVIFGLAFIGPTAPYSMYGIATVKSNGHLPLVYSLAMIAMSFTALSYGRMATAFPEAGSTYTYTTKALHPTAGFFAGWALMLDYILIPMLSVIFVALTANKVWPETPYWLWAVIATAGITAINLGGIQVTSRANYLTNAIMFASLVWFIALAVKALFGGVGEGALFSSKPFFNPQTFDFSSVMNTTSLAVLSFIGFDGISTLAEDAKDPRRDIARATVLVCLVAGGLFILESYLAQMVWPDYTGFSPVETAFMDIGKRIGGAALFFYLSFVLVVGGIASAITGQAGASRLLCGLGRDRILPYRIFGYVHPRFRTPIYSVLLMGAVHLAGALILRYAEAAELVNFGAFIGFMLVNLCVVRHYWLRAGERSAGQTIVNLVLPLLGFTVCFYIWLHLSAFALKLGALWMAIGCLYLLFSLKRRHHMGIIALLVLLFLPVSGHSQSSSDGVLRMRRLLQLPQDKTPPKAETVGTSGDQTILLEDLKIQADAKNWIPAMIAKPRSATGRLPVIICLPGTSGTRLHLTDPVLQLPTFPRTGWARALAAEGFLTISLDYRGSPAREQNIYTDAVRAQLAGGTFMGQLVHEVIRTVDYLQTRPDVDPKRIGITGFSLGGAMTWYAAAADPRLSVIVPVCGGAGTYDALTGNQKKTSYHSQYFYPAGFLKSFPGDQPDVFSSLAPRAVLIVGRDQDQGMPIEGLRKLEEDVKSVYAKRGAADRFAVHVTVGEHTYTDEMFAQVKAWFARFLR